MYLTRIELDAKKRATMKALASPSILHGAIESSFVGERKRRLWRIDNLNSHCYLLLLSEDIPDTKIISGQFGVTGDNRSETKSYEPLLQRIENGSTWHFRLVANPTRKCMGDEEKGKTKAHITPEMQKQWLIKRSEKHGFSVDENSFEIVGDTWMRFYKGNERKRVSMISVTYEGILTITDAELFKKTLTEGIGREKAFGMGMLTIVRPR